MEKARSFEEIYRQSDRFILDWKDAAGDERQEAQMFVRDLLTVYGLTSSRAALYERRAKRSSTGRQGYIDALVPGILAIEMKSAGEDLAQAEAQALDYLNDLPDAEFPDWVLTSDFKTFRLLNLKEGSDTEAVEWPIESLRDHADKLAFLAGYGQRVLSFEEREAASIKAAQLMASLYEGLAESGYDEHASSVFMVRCLFMLYADDTALWGERDLFLEFLENRTEESGNDLGPMIAQLFQMLKTPAERRPKNLTGLLARFPYVNGGLFEEDVAIPFFDADMRRRLIEACYFNWSAISPAIFGSLFQAVKDKAARRSLGAHYTTERNILRVINPMFLDELIEEFEAKRDSVRGLRNLRERLGQMQFFDPACGCGNFLIIAYREMRALELRIIERIQELEADRKSASALDEGLFFMGEQVSVRIRNFHGIEIEDWPARIAATALHLVEHQANQEMQARLGAAPELLPLDKVETIHSGNALRMDWAHLIEPTDSLYVLGNPPFIGMNGMSKDQQEDNRQVFALIDSKGLRPGRLDYVACWYAKTMHYLNDVPGARAAFVSTNSITQGEQARTMVPLLERNGYEVDFGHQTFKWTSEAPGAASVHCVIIGFSHRTRPGRRRRLFTYENINAEPQEKLVKRLNFYLADGPNIVPVKLRRPLVEGMPTSHKGSQPTDGKFLLVNEDQYDEVAADSSALPYLKRFVQGRDMLQEHERRWCLWLKDADPRDLRNSKVLRERIAGVERERAKSKTDSVREFGNPRLFTQDRQPETDYFALPEVSSENREWIPGRLYSPDVVAGNKLIVFPDAKPWHAALLQSSMFMAWVEVFAGRLKSDYSFSPGLSYFPIPWPYLDDSLQDQLASAWATVSDARGQFSDATLADLYDAFAMPDVLRSAHRGLDVIVDRAFGSNRRLSDNTERLELLLRRYRDFEDRGLIT
ncbi:class I SAM-dependent DNA methyltransferase [Nesterenkonia cremea]|uniref:site-specific DNA-methyltransferase (adenine-specific) n=1 Tax=Nesterenkonia cremea TaxID=1882340 RepID=A0A917AXP9_9MICC|nr:class I SAM-dependent DNA methyltransferase [Nesterenkonia cremea]GGE78773.1 methylase [Nesterenkonia cremea]